MKYAVGTRCCCIHDSCRRVYALALQFFGSTVKVLYQSLGVEAGSRPLLNHVILWLDVKFEYLGACIID